MAHTHPASRFRCGPGSTVAVVGAGHNGLVAAAYLANAGYHVTLFESNEQVGGMCVTEELFPGYQVSSVASWYGMLRKEIVEELRLEQYGLRTYVAEPVQTAFLPHGDVIVTATDPELRQAALNGEAGTDAHDEEAMNTLWEEISRASQLLEPLLLRTVPPSKQDVVDLFASHSLDRLSKAIFETSWADLVAPIVTSDRYRAAMTYETYGDPWARGSVFMTAYMGTAITNNKKGRWGRAMGGMGSVTQALAGAAEAAGVRIHTNTAVLSILVEQGTACGVVAGGARIMFDAVVCGCNPRTMEELLPSSYRTDISRNAEQPSFAGAKLHLALNRLPRVAVALDPDLVYRSGTIAIIPDLPQMRASYRPGSTRAPQREFVLSGYVPSYYDESLAPSGKHILSFDIHAVGFGEDREQLLSQLMAYIAISFPDIASCTDDALLLLPEDIAGRYGSSLCHHWNVSGPLMDERPAPGYSGARTPTPGLYLCGSGAYPGGFVSGIPGWNCARTIIDSTSKRET